MRRMLFPVLLYYAPPSNCRNSDDPADSDLLVGVAPQRRIAGELEPCLVEELPGTSVHEFMVNAG